MQRWVSSFGIAGCKRSTDDEMLFNGLVLGPRRMSVRALRLNGHHVNLTEQGSAKLASP